MPSLLLIYFEQIMDSEARDIPVDWGMPDTPNGAHPIYFAKHMSKAISMDYDKKMDYPSNGVSILGYLRPAFLDEESYIRRLFLSENRDDYSLEVQGDDNTSTSSKHDEKDLSSSLYRLEIVGIELLSLYGTESVSTTEGLSSGIALKALCKKKGLHAGEANLISVDSVGMDVRVFAGAQVQTHRFPFKTRATTEMAAEKNIHQLMFPPSRRRKLKSNDKSLKDAYRSKKHYQNHQTKKQRRSYFATGTVCGVYTSSFLLRLCT
ncbi:hypothetical protein DY000_02061758 [Brassica cretica]|uniref:Uncharacterized protein n=1 Tax=Brassica cretica TaxID=69181 RepID=A0ABQ7AXV1_BRACR|nr:hypothetical protein DY000_02061758 [Brassica cretica]